MKEIWTILQRSKYLAIKESWKKTKRNRMKKDGEDALVKKKYGEHMKNKDGKDTWGH